MVTATKPLMLNNRDFPLLRGNISGKTQWKDSGLVCHKFKALQKHSGVVGCKPKMQEKDSSVVSGKPKETVVTSHFHVLELPLHPCPRHTQVQPDVFLYSLVT